MIRLCPVSNKKGTASAAIELPLSMRSVSVCLAVLPATVQITARRARNSRKTIGASVAIKRVWRERSAGEG